MPISAGAMIRINVLCEQYLQTIHNTLDYRVMAGANIPNEELLADFVSHWQANIMDLQVTDMHGVRATMQRFQAAKTFVRPNSNVNRLRIQWDEKTVYDMSGLNGAQANLGDTPLPTFCCVSARKIAGGTVYRGTQAGGTTVVTGEDARWRGGIRFSGISEDATENAQGNKLADTVGDPWWTSWKTAIQSLRVLNFVEGAFGQAYQLQMCVRSDYGPYGQYRFFTNIVDEETIETPYILWQLVSSLSVNRYLGSQTTRKQYEQFQ